MSEQITTAKPTIDWKTWILWVFVCAIVPVINTLSVLMLNKPTLGTNSNAASIDFAGTVLFIFSLSIPLLQWLVLRRIFRLNLAIWMTVLLLPAFVYYALISYTHWAIYYIPWIENFKTIIIQLRMDVRHYAAVSYTAWHIGWSFWFKAVIVASVAAIIPSLILERSSGRKWYFFLIAALTGMLAEAIVNQIYSINFIRFPSFIPSHDPSLLMRIQELILRGSLGAIFGAVSGAVLLVLYYWYYFNTMISKIKHTLYTKLTISPP